MTQYFLPSHRLVVDMVWAITGAEAEAAALVAVAELLNLLEQ